VQTETETSPDLPPRKTPMTESDEVKREFSQDKRDKLAKTPKAMNDGSYPIENITDLKNAINAYGRADEDKRPDLRAHIVRNAKRLNATNMLPKNWTETPAGEKKSHDDFTAGVLLGLAGFDVSEMLELKAGPPGATFPSPDPGATKLRKYWTKGPGAAKVRWGTPGDFKRCVHHMSKFVGERAEGLCNIYHRSAIGVAPGQERKSDDSAVLWVPDSSVPGGWRADQSAWATETKKVDVVDRTDDEIMSTLDKYEGMQDSVEQAYESAIAADISWTLEPDGELSDAEGDVPGDEQDIAPSLFGDIEDGD
jgi:hypothetical protein